jgi:hypothetical protein
MSYMESHKIPWFQSPPSSYDSWGKKQMSSGWTTDPPAISTKDEQIHEIS